MESIIRKRILKTIIAFFAVTLIPVSFPSYSTASTPSYTSARTPKLADLQALTFRSASVTVNGKRYALASKNSIDLRFEEKTISITAGCNTLGGNYALDKGVIRAQTLFSTKMACMGKLMSQDIWLNQLFSSKPKLTVQFITAKSKIKTPATILTLTSNIAPSLKAGKTVIKMNVYETYGYADTPLGDENSTSLVKSTCEKLLLSKATESEAQFAAEQNGLLFRVVAREGESYAVTFDYRDNRVNVIILDGKVSTCSQG
jgi:heat shock protein HslJ